MLFSMYIFWHFYGSTALVGLGLGLLIFDASWSRLCVYYTRLLYTLVASEFTCDLNSLATKSNGIILQYVQLHSLLAG
jgi:hypothetical protein